MEESRGTLPSAVWTIFAINSSRLAVGLLQNLRPQCKFGDRVVTTGDRFRSFLDEFPSCVVDSET